MKSGGGRRAALQTAFALLHLAIPVQAWGQDAAPAGSPSPISARFSIDWIAAVRGSSPAEGALNPGNLVLRLPQLLVPSELRGNLRVELGSRAQLVVRPRARAEAAWAWSEGRSVKEDRDIDADWTELYFACRATDAVAITWGLQNFQWGPAELLAPNNRIFHEEGFFRDPLYYVRGRHLLRLNVSPGKRWNVVAMAELGANGDTPFRAGEHFARQVLGKIEYTTADGASYVGATAGATDGTPPWWGGYGSLGLTEGLSLYADASVTQGSRAWYPVRVEGWPAFARPHVGDDARRTLAVVGARYTFARGDDLRLEWLGHDAGWTRGELRTAFDAARAAVTPEAFAPYLAPGLEFLGRQLGLVSLYVPDLPPSKRLRVHGRYLQSFTDTSGVLFATGSFEATGALVVFASATATGGPREGEFSRLVRASIVAGTVYTW